MHKEWLLKRNCSLTPRQLGRAYGLLCLFSLTVAGGFAALGYWFVPCFSFLELSGVAWALVRYARHATDSERIALSGAHIVIDRIEAGQASHIELDSCWTRIHEPQRRRQLIALEQRGTRVEIGSFVSEQTRRQVARELKSALRGAAARL